MKEATTLREELERQGNRQQPLQKGDDVIGMFLNISVETNEKDE